MDNMYILGLLRCLLIFIGRTFSFWFYISALAITLVFLVIVTKFMEAFQETFVGLQHFVSVTIFPLPRHLEDISQNGKLLC